MTRLQIPVAGQTRQSPVQASIIESEVGSLVSIDAEPHYLDSDRVGDQEAQGARFTGRKEYVPMQIASSLPATCLTHRHHLCVRRRIPVIGDAIEAHRDRGTLRVQHHRAKGQPASMHMGNGMTQ